MTLSNERKEQLMASFQRSGMMNLFEARVSGMDMGYFEVTVGKKEFMARPAGMYNGSTIATLVDVSSGYAAAAAKPVDSYFTTVELKVNYLNPAMGEQLRAKAQVVKNGKVLSVVRVDVYTLQGATERLVATSLVTLMQLSGRTRTTQEPID